MELSGFVTGRIANVSCRKHSPGNPCYCIPPDCEFVEADLPTVNITGMTEATGWLFFNSGDCCIASKRFTFDVTQDDIVLDGGDVLTWDKTEVCETERFSIDKTCGTATQVLWTASGDRGLIIPPDEPAYDCCDPITITQVHTLTKTARNRGGRRFVVTIHATAIWVTFQKTSSYVCAPDPAVTRWIMRSYMYFDGSYSFIDYKELSTSYTSTANTTCWEWPADTTEGTYPWDIDAVDNVVVYTGTLPSSGILCRQKVLTTIPSVETSYTFLDTDVNDPDCVQPWEVCEGDLCFSSGDIGDDEPTGGFSEAKIISKETDAAYQLQLCTEHVYYWWSNPIDPLIIGFPPCLTIFENMFAAPPDIMQDAVLCCTDYGGWGQTSGNFSDAICTIPAYTYPTWTTLTAGGPESGIIEYCDYTSLKAGQVYDDCWPTQSCPACPTGSQTGDSNHNLVVAAGTQTVLKAGGARIVELTRSVTCSGYVEQEVCLPFAPWTGWFFVCAF